MRHKQEAKTMAEIVTMGELLCEIMRPTENVELYETGYFRGPFPSGAPGIFISTAARLGCSAGIITPDKDKTDEPSSKTEKTDAPSLKSEEKVMEESPRTGDDSRIFLWLSLLLASGIAGITTAFVYCRRE